MCHQKPNMPRKRNAHIKQKKTACCSNGQSRGEKIEKENPFNVIKKERRWFGNKTILYEKGIITQGSFLENYDSLTKNNSTDV